MPAGAITGGGAELEEKEGRRIEPIGLVASAAAIDLDAGRVDDRVSNVAGSEGPMEPEAIAARFVAGDDRRVRR
jgi:hypothetical protein